MLFNTNLEEIIFNRHEFVNCDELIIISGYVGPSPIERLSTLPIPSTVIYGMYGSQSISARLHNTLLHLDTIDANTTILYSQIPVHSKCYIWRNNGIITYALIGSANFSTSGLTIPFRETLAETTSDTFMSLNEYINQIMTNSLRCSEVTLNEASNNLINLNTNTNISSNLVHDSNVCQMILFDPRTNEVPTASGLNWCHSPNGNISIDDGYIPIRTSHIRTYPNLFPPKQATPTTTVGGRPHRQNDSIEIIWDDGTIMQGLLEGSQPVDGVIFPKNLCSFPRKNILGSYIRRRLGLSSGSLVTRADLDNYGRDNIAVSLLSDGTYYIDFSV